MAREAVGLSLENINELCRGDVLMAHDGFVCHGPQRQRLYVFEFLYVREKDLFLVSLGQKTPFSCSIDAAIGNFSIIF